LGKNQVQANYGVAMHFVNQKIVSIRDSKCQKWVNVFSSQLPLRRDTVIAAIQ
jgi:hypothetical protein